MRKERIRELAETIYVTDRFDPKQFINPKTTPVVSIYVPIKRTEREDRRDEWDRIEFKDLAKEAERRLAENYDTDQVKGIIEKINYILEHEDLPLWIKASKGLAFLISNDAAYVINMNIAPKACVVAGNDYYLKPLFYDAQYDMDYKLLLLNSDFFALLDGDYNGVHYEPLPQDVKDFFAETYPEFDGETTALDYYSLEDHHSPYADHKSRNEVTQEETEKFFRYVDKAMNDKLVRDDDTPVILVTAPEHENLFRKICSFQTLLPTGIDKDARTLSGTELRDGAVKIMEGIKDTKIDDLIEKYQYHASKGNATNSIPDIGLALVERKVAVLFIEEGKGLPGTFNDETGEVDFDASTNPVDDKELDPASPDIAGAFACATAAQDGEVVVLSADKMPVKNGIAALYRY